MLRPWFHKHAEEGLAETIEVATNDLSAEGGLDTELLTNKTPPSAQATMSHDLGVQPTKGNLMSTWELAGVTITSTLPNLATASVS